MQYRTDKYGHRLSVLGFGCMRFSRQAGRIDLAKAEREILAAVAGGVNYFDTAYIYPGSEAALGEILERNGIRDQVYIATKLPHYLMKSRDALDKLFAEQLRRLRTDHVDYYLMHMLTDTGAWDRLKAMGIEEWLLEKKASGAIRQIGFSYHGNSDMFCHLIDAWDWDFCQIQYNYMDEHTQAGRKGLLHAHQKGIPVIIMPCPKHVDIPGTFAAYNRRYQEGWFWGFRDYLMCTMLRKHSTAASNCVRCGLCEKHCPQHIAIRDTLQSARRELEGPLYKALSRLIRLFAKF